MSDYVVTANDLTWLEAFMNLIRALYADIPFRRDIPTPFQYNLCDFQRGDATPHKTRLICIGF